MEAFAQNATAVSRSMLTEEISTFLDQTLTKMQLTILKILYENRELQQKALAISANTSATSLSNHLNKLESIEPSLLTITKDGRAKYYALTPIAKAYIEQKLKSHNSSKIYNFTKSSHSNSLDADAFHLLAQFQDIAGYESWSIQMHFLLSNEISHVNYQLQDIFSKFMDTLTELTIQEDSDSLRKIFDQIEHSELVRKIETKIEEAARYHRALKPLLSLEKQSTGLAYRLIDAIFQEMYPSIFAALSDDTPLRPPLIPEEHYYSVFYCITKMINDFSGCYGKKELAVKHWQTVYFSDSACFYYIAEKCLSIYRKNTL